MTLEIKIPSPGESISEVEIGRWLVENGSMVKKDQEIAEVESDKATFSLSASADGKINLLLKEGERVSVGSVACTIDTEAPADKTEQKEEKAVSAEAEKTETTEEVKAPESKTLRKQKTEKEIKETIAQDKKPEEGKTDEGKITENEIQEDFTRTDKTETSDYSQVKFTAAAKAVMDEEGLSVDEVMKGLHRITKQEVESIVNLLKSEFSDQVSGSAKSRTEERSTMSPLRRKLSQRLVAVKNETAMLTTFNEIDMQRLIQLRSKYQKNFSEKHGIKLGYMSFFTKAASIALKQFPIVNSTIDGEEIVSPGYQDIGIAVQTEKGLMVPIIRDAGTKSIAELEREIFELAERARTKKLTVQEMTGGTFTITNGGLFGSLFSTPILNPPQSAILGMHAIKDRPVAVDGKVEIRPMMYVALTYDHRLIDGKISVSFLVKIKQLIENPASMILEGKDPEDMLLGL
jgi:2-oxoglutarate dehydrogenase E2 component (dihydrolipoamide succinyltransferase)